MTLKEKSMIEGDFNYSYELFFSLTQQKMDTSDFSFSFQCSKILLHQMNRKYLSRAVCIILLP